MAKTIIIAEVGECFNGNLNTAARLIREAKMAGCDIVKFQTLDYETIKESDPEKDWFKKIALGPERIRYLIHCARAEKIKIMFTPENIKTAQWLLDSGLKDVKISSSSITDYCLLKFVNSNFKRAFLSTGMASLGEVKKAVKCLNKISDLYIMHCISEYPTGPLLKKRGLKALAEKDARLNMMRILMREFPQYKVGYSDHTEGIRAAVMAAVMGARVIEKHITLDRGLPLRNFKNRRNYLGTDHVLSLEPPELLRMVKDIRETEAILGPLKWERTSAELLLRNFIRRRFVGKN